MCGGQPSPHKPRLVVSHSTCPPISPPPPREQLCTRSCSNKHTHTHTHQNCSVTWSQKSTPHFHVGYPILPRLLYCLHCRVARATSAKFRLAIMAIPYTVAGCNSWFSHGRYTRSYGTVSSIGLLGQNCKPYMVVHSRFQYFSLSTQQWLLLAPDRPCAQHVQSTRRMRLTVKRPSTKGLPFLLE